MRPVHVQAVVLGACAAFLFAAAASNGHAQEPFHKGKRLTVLINFAAGGPADIEGRIFAKHLVKRIDGQPDLVVQNTDGAGGLIGAQYLGEIAPKDGSVLGALTGAAWIHASDSQRWRVDFRSDEFVARETAPDMSQQVRAMLVASPEICSYINDYMRNVPKRQEHDPEK